MDNIMDTFLSGKHEARASLNLAQRQRETASLALSATLKLIY